MKKKEKNTVSKGGIYTFVVIGYILCAIMLASYYCCVLLETQQYQFAIPGYHDTFDFIDYSCLPADKQLQMERYSFTWFVHSFEYTRFLHVLNLLLLVGAYKIIKKETVFYVVYLILSFLLFIAECFVGIVILVIYFVNSGTYVLKFVPSLTCPAPSYTTSSEFVLKMIFCLIFFILSALQIAYTFLFSVVINRYNKKLAASEGYTAISNNEEKTDYGYNPNINFMYANAPKKQFSVRNVLSPEIKIYE